MGSAHWLRRAGRTMNSRHNPSDKLRAFSRVLKIVADCRSANQKSQIKNLKSGISNVRADSVPVGCARENSLPAASPDPIVREHDLARARPPSSARGFLRRGRPSVLQHKYRKIKNIALTKPPSEPSNATSASLTGLPATSSDNTCGAAPRAASLLGHKTPCVRAGPRGGVQHTGRPWQPTPGDVYRTDRHFPRVPPQLQRLRESLQPSAPFPRSGDRGE